MCGIGMEEGGPLLLLDNRERLLCFTAVAPWDTAGVEKVSFFTSLSVQCNKKVDSDEDRRKATEATLRDRGPHTYELWTDGSVVDEIGAGAAILFEGEHALGHARAPSGFLSTSFRSEQVAMDAGLLLTLGGGGTGVEIMTDSTLLVCTDSQSLVSALSKGPLRQDNWLSSMIWKKFLKLVQERGVQKIDVQFVASHCGVVRNELADQAADQAFNRMKDVQEAAYIPLSAVKAKVKRHTREAWVKKLDPLRLRHRLSGGRSTKLSCYKDMEREDAVTLAQLRSGKSKLMGELPVTLGLRRGSLCRWCGAVPETVEHVYTQCSSDDLVALRDELNISSINVLYDNPDNALLFCWEAIALL
jgi:ribonuclease HI